MTAHEDDLRLALHEARVGVTPLEVAVELQAHEQEHGREVLAWRDRFLSSLSQVFGHAECPSKPPDCKWCRDTGSIGNDIPCRCPVGVELDGGTKEVPEAAAQRSSIVP
jgi:hypothetical protein